MSAEYLEASETFLAQASKELTEFEQQILEEAMSEVSLMNEQALNISLLRSFKKRWFTRSYCKELTQHRRSESVKTVFYAMVVREFILRKKIKLPSVNELSIFPFSESDALSINQRDNVDHLLGYVRAIKCLQELGLKGHNNKRLFMTVGAMLEGSGLSYATGGAPSKSTQRREIIFEILTGESRSNRLVSRKETTDGDVDINVNIDIELERYAADAMLSLQKCGRDIEDHFGDGTADLILLKKSLPPPLKFGPDSGEFSMGNRVSWKKRLREGEEYLSSKSKSGEATE